MLWTVLTSRTWKAYFTLIINQEINFSSALLELEFSFAAVLVVWTSKSNFHEVKLTILLSWSKKLKPSITIMQLCCCYCSQNLRGPFPVVTVRGTSRLHFLTSAYYDFPKILKLKPESRPESISIVGCLAFTSMHKWMFMTSHTHFIWHMGYFIWQLSLLFSCYKSANAYFPLFLYFPPINLFYGNNFFFVFILMGPWLQSN